MTPEHKQKAISLREQGNSEYKAQVLIDIAQHNNGPTSHNCFCKSSNITHYINAFYEWFDSLNLQQDE